VWKECCAAAAVYIFLTVKNVQLSQFIQHDKNKSQPPLIHIHRKVVLWRSKNFSRHFLSFRKKNLYDYDYRLDYEWIFWVVNFKTRNYFVIFYYTECLNCLIYLRSSVYDCSNFVHSCRIFGISEL
jgi:hypothetical protein